MNTRSSKATATARLPFAAPVMKMDARSMTAWSPTPVATPFIHTPAMATSSEAPPVVTVDSLPSITKLADDTPAVASSPTAEYDEFAVPSYIDLELVDSPDVFANFHISIRLVILLPIIIMTVHCPTNPIRRILLKVCRTFLLKISFLMIHLALPHHRLLYFPINRSRY